MKLAQIYMLSQALQARLAPEMKAIKDDDGRIEFISGWAGVYDERDRVGDTLKPGSFKAAIEYVSSGGRIPSHYAHNLEDQPIGMVVELKDLQIPGTDLVGPWYRTAVSREEKAQSIARQVDEGMIRSSSFSYFPVDTKGPRGSRDLLALDVFEIGPTTVPIQPLAGGMDAKGLGDLVAALSHLTDARRSLDQANFRRDTEWSSVEATEEVEAAVEAEFGAMREYLNGLIAPAETE